jgi:hypothetical protein
MSICGDLIDSAEKVGTLLDQIITGDETWGFLYNPQLKQQLATRKSSSSSREKKPRQDGSKGKVMLEVFFDSSGIHPRRDDCKQAPLQGDLSPSMQFNSS